MEDEEANIGALGEEEGKIDSNDQRISIEDENAAIAGDESLAAKEGNIRVPSNAIPHRHSANYPNQMTITNQSSWQIEEEARVNWEAQLRRHQQKQVSNPKSILLQHDFRFPTKMSQKSWNTSASMSWNN